AAPPRRPLVPAQGPAAVSIRDLSYRHADGHVLAGVDLDLASGSLTVLTGPVGSGKSTLLRVLLGLLPADAGTVRWDGEAVADLAVHMTPPRCAYVAQVPRLFSVSLGDNVRVGLDAHDDTVRSALRAAALERDVEEMELGLDTLVGPRGVRLSGGQAQRTAAARALLRRPALLVLDDLSSALDGETEQRLWQQLLDGDHPTLLAVSHRAAVLARADRVVVLTDGRLRQATRRG
ncbi:MAG: ATP-binding cassette domain-containing protein, partial [Egibacteraceae bacterium]